MRDVSIFDIRPGWKVFDHEAAELGSVAEIDRSTMRVTRGLIRRHEYVVPVDAIASAGEGVVDLSIEKSELEHGQALEDGRADDLPEEFRRTEFHEEPAAPSPLDVTRPFGR